MSDTASGRGVAPTARLPAGLHRRRHDGDVSDLASHLGAALVTTQAEVDALLSEPLPTATADQLAAMAALTSRAQMAARVVERTRTRAATEVSQRLASNAGSEMAIHPETYRDAAARVVDARQALDRATSQLADRDRARADQPEPPANPQPDPSDQREIDELQVSGDPGQATADMDLFGPDRELDLGGERGRTIRARTIGAISVALGLGLVLFGLRVVPLWVALLPTLAVCLVAMWLLRDRDDDGDEADDADAIDPAARALLADVAAATDAAFGASRQRDIERSDDRQLLVARRDRAQEDLRVAERAWHDLAGPDADADEVDEVIRRRDPQHQEALVLAAETATVRAATALLERSHRRWTEAWSELGLAAPEELDQRAVDELVHAATRPILVTGEVAERAEDIAKARPHAAVVVLDRGGADPEGVWGAGTPPRDRPEGGFADP